MQLFTPSQLTQYKKVLQKQVHIGVTREGGVTTKDGGVMAIPTHITALGPLQIGPIPEGMTAIAAACGGTNWVFSTATKQADGSLVMQEMNKRPIAEPARVHTVASLSGLMADQISETIVQAKLEQQEKLPIAISFGFPHVTVRMDNGDVDARIMHKQLPKYWQVTDCNESLPAEEQASFADNIRTALSERGHANIGRIVFVNDTVAVVLDVQEQKEEIHLPVGFVFGTGTNGAMQPNEEKGIINLEAGQAQVIDADPVHNAMVAGGLIPSPDPIIEHWMAGAYIPVRIAAALDVMPTKPAWYAKCRELFLSKEHQTIVSDIASGDMNWSDFDIEMNPSEAQMLQELAKASLAQAGQLMAVMVAAVVAELGYTTGTTAIPYEGALLQKGVGVMDAFMAALGELLPGHGIEMYHAAGVAGVAKLAMIKNLV